MMKYVTNQPFDFINPGCAFFVALMQTIGGLMAEIACIVFLGSIDNPMLVIISFVGLASLSKVDDIYFSALPQTGNKILKATMPLVVKVRLRDWEASAKLMKEDPNSEDIIRASKDKVLMEHKSCIRTFGRFIYKTFRVIDGALLFYFFPFLSLVLPFIATS